MQALYALALNADRLDPKDAKEVQIIHTDAVLYGMINRHGTVDFCVNGGTQPYCRRTRSMDNKT